MSLESLKYEMSLYKSVAESTDPFLQAVGDEVTGFEEGDEVIALIPFDQQGAAAEYALVSSHDLAIKPPSLSFAEAASLPLSGLIAYQALINHASAMRCQKVLIIGAGGGTGVMAVQIAKSLRLVVSALCSGSKKDLVRSLGANAVFDYNINPPSSLCHDYDIVLDLVGGKTLSQCIKLVKGNGQMVCVACPATCDERSQRPDVRTDFFIVEPDGDELTEIVQMAEQGVIVPVVHTIIPFEKGAEAFKLLEKGHTTGKIVLTVDE